MIHEDILIFLFVQTILHNFYIEGYVLIIASILGSYIIFSLFYEWRDRDKPSPSLIIDNILIVWINIHIILLIAIFMHNIGYIYNSYIYNPIMGYHIVQKIEHYLIIPLWLSIFEQFFYWTHRLLHYPYLYKVHKWHHKYRETRAIYCQYSHPIDCLISTCIPIYSIFLFIKIPIHIFISTLVVMIKHNTEGHRYRPINNIEHHNIHHRDGRYNYGNLPITDWLFGTLR